MSVRDEMARALLKRRWPDYDFDEHLRMYEAGQAVNPKVYNDTTIGNAYADRDCLMPIVERVAREAAIQGVKLGSGAGMSEAFHRHIDAIVRRVVGDSRPE